MKPKVGWKVYDRKGVLALLIGMFVAGIVLYFVIGLDVKVLLISMGVVVLTVAVGWFFGIQWRKRWVCNGWYDENGELAVPPNAEFHGIDRLLMPLNKKK
jgi:hypothetical protein